MSWLGSTIQTITIPFLRPSLTYVPPVRTQYGSGLRLQLDYLSTTQFSPRSLAPFGFYSPCEIEPLALTTSAPAMTGPALPVDHPKPGLGCFNRSITAIYGNVHCFHRRGAPRSIRWHTFDQVYLLRAKTIVGRKRTEVLHGLSISRDIGAIPLSPRRQPRLGQADDLETGAFNLSPDPERHCQAASPGGLCLRHRV
ncbi:uncharacterized protein BDZ83DRAFT_646314 [Colletotrichum acutatum]|uniref:Uncharacterized protein n=1 Tax=Glomerella acutata TaxID=27357 RepID=A0AAD8XQ43_GLOAC|nr:uncharacterized protein BDZ83DRAFT_646314 [Colletotrichum acutatum]KAK1731354.1 hypothetical protein BDZ83DRAFT_646314 [Colletotrichum acutatum]